MTAAVALAIGWIQWPRPPDLDGERWFKLVLATLLRGRFDAEGATAAAWEREVLRAVPYHPAGRFPERKLSNPVAAALPGAALPGEQALLEALAALPDPISRAARMYDEDAAGRDARLSDPAELGADYDPSRLGPGATWDTLAAWGAGDRGFVEAARRAVPARWVLLDGRPGQLVGPSVLGALAEALGDDGVLARFPYAEDDPVAGRILALLGGPADRVVLAAEEAGVARALSALVDDAELRDRVLAVVSIGGVIGGRTDDAGLFGEVSRRDWLGAHFNHEDLDTDLVRRTTYLAIQWLDRGAWPPGAPGLPLSSSRFPEPRAGGAITATVESVDLGVLPCDRELPLDLVARGIVAVVLGWIHTRR